MVVGALVAQLGRGARAVAVPFGYGEVSLYDVAYPFPPVLGIDVPSGELVTRGCVGADDQGLSVVSYYQGRHRRRSED